MDQWDDSLWSFHSDPSLRGNWFEIAFNQYKDTVIKTGIFEKEVSSAIFSLEALLSEGHKGIAKKVSRRAFVILRYFNLNSNDVYQIFHEAYHIRSQVAHGKALTEADHEFTRQHRYKIIDWVRRCILLTLLTGNYKGDQRDFLEQIDHNKLAHVTNSISGILNQ